MGLNWAVTGLENQEAACSLVGFLRLSDSASMIAFSPDLFNATASCLESLIKPDVRRLSEKVFGLQAVAGAARSVAAASEPVFGDVKRDS